MVRKNVIKVSILTFILIVIVLYIITKMNTNISPIFDSNLLYKESTFELDFDSLEDKKMTIADGWSNEGQFDCTWEKDNVIFGDSVMSLYINDGNEEGEYTGGEYSSDNIFGYGDYEIIMKPIKNDGVVSSFFVYTGSSNNTQWDEIDIEFLGKDTTKVQFNYYTNGIGKHEYIYDLGFDSSEEFHKYEFKWRANSIRWYVDGKLAHIAFKNIPHTPGKIMMNVWPGIGVDDWLKPYDGTTPLKAEYEYMYYYSMMKI